MKKEKFHSYRIGVISDTHIPRRSRSLPSIIFEQFQGVDLIIHTGDLVDEVVLDDLSALAPVEAVAGNNDPLTVIQRFGWKRILEIGPWKIGMTHGHIGKASSTPDCAFEMFANDQVDVIVFGHSHKPYLEERNGILLFNAGSPTDRRRETQYSIGILTLDVKPQASWIKWS
ncbi:phosphoesterase [Collibacillus ludicampi]|uniref:Phosphoesterase n=1 Tax=Collibacillus ludicampi TaxID=2771369 RepID=A0AAV4LHY4_9BACL|nr:metallophosphoesterase family protein [Collibacillus ludicampi]GIM47139.1 phosphoesterase [Collibacillus ludicampi]